MKQGIFQRFGRRSAATAITAGTLVLVLVLNLLFSLLFSATKRYTDMTGEEMYTLSDGAEYLLKSTIDDVNDERPKEDPVQVDIIFCADPDMLCSNELTRYIYYTALQMERVRPASVKVSTVDVWKNPSAVDAYRVDSHSSIYQSNIIIASGTEFRLYSPAAFYRWDNTGYYGEQVFLQGILAVTQAESPICALTVGHGEPFETEEGKEQYSTFLSIIEASGYEVCTVDLSKEEIPENCRLIITFDPQRDFLSSFMQDNTVSEVKKLDAYLSEDNAYMVFADADTPYLPNLETYLEEWGITFGRYAGTDADGQEWEGRLQLSDPDNRINADGSFFYGEYESASIGGGITKDMREQGGSPKVVFGNATEIAYSPLYQQAYELADEDTGEGAYTYAFFHSNGHTREMFDLFRTGGSSLAYANNANGLLTDASGNPVIADTYGSYRLMTVTMETRFVSEGNGMISNINNATYVCAASSTAFASNEALSSNAYGNTDALLSLLRTIGLDLQPVGISIKPMAFTEIGSDGSSDDFAEYYSASLITAWTTALMLIPAVAFCTAGCVILIRRRMR